MEKTEKKRGANFTQGEKVLLAELVEKNIELINSKYKSTVTNQIKKQVWDDIDAQLNARGGEKRTGQQIKDKWRKCCGTAREEVSKERANMKITGGGPCSVKAKDPVLEKVLALHEGAPTFYGIEGGQELGFNFFDNPDMNDNEPSEFVVINPPNCSQIPEGMTVLATIDINQKTTEVTQCRGKKTTEVNECPGKKVTDVNKGTEMNAVNVCPAEKPSTSKQLKKPAKQLTLQQLQMEVLKLDKGRIIKQKRKLIAEREKIELEKTLLRLQIKKLKQDMNEQ